VEPVAAFRAARSAGFTLIEVLVVLAILAITAAAVTLLTPPGEAALARDEARRLAALLETAMREARASGRPIAWSAERERYVFWQRGEDGDWIPYPPHSVYRPRALAERIELAGVQVDGREVAAGERVVFVPHGLRGALGVTVSGAGTRYSIQGDVIGRVAFDRVHAR
jgi:general secretion pathway protein H